MPAHRAWSRAGQRASIRPPVVAVTADTRAEEEVDPAVRVAAGRLVLRSRPTDSPWLNPIVMLWRLGRREVTHGELLATVQALLTAVRACFDRDSRTPEEVLSIPGAPTPQNSGRCTWRCLRAASRGRGICRGLALRPASRSIRRMLLRHRIRLPIHVATPGALADHLEMLVALADPRAATLARTAAAIRAMPLGDVLAELERRAAAESDPEQRGILEGCAEAVRRVGGL